MYDHPNPKHRNEIINWCRKILTNKNKFLILDTETTGLGKRDIIIQIALIDMDENPIIDTLIKPRSRKTIPADATKIHGITFNMLSNAPDFPAVFIDFKKAIKNKGLIIYNAAFDSRMIDQTINIERVKGKIDAQAYCAMIAYSTYIGDWSDYHESYTFQKLPGGDHTALGDCKATLKIIKEMAEAELSEIPKKKWQFWK